jgi:hypothetical protein
MMPQAQEAPKEPSRQKIAAEKMTKIENISRAMRSGMIKSELRTAQESIWMAKATDQQMQTAGVDPKDRRVYIAYMTPDLTVLSTLRFVEGQETALYSTLTAPGTCCIFVGLIFAMRDHEHNGDWLFAHKPFLLTPNVTLALKQRMADGAGLDGID